MGGPTAWVCVIPADFQADPLIEEKRFMKSKMLTRVGAAAVGLGLAVSLTACGGDGAGSGTANQPAGNNNQGTTEPGEGGGGDGLRVGVAMPTQTSERWVNDGNSVRDGLEAQGFTVNLQFANDDIPTQQQQIEAMITDGVDVLIVASIDGAALSGPLGQAHAAGIPVIAYDRLITGTEFVDFYVTFDNYEVGVQQGTSLLQGLGVLDYDGNETGATGPFNIELFAGSLDDNNAHLFWQGAMDTLQPFLDSGVLVVPSGQTNIEQAATLRWSQETAQQRMENLITAHYGGGTGQLDGVLSPFDGISRGIITALSNAGMGTDLASGLAVLTGQDAEIASVNLIYEGVQYSTIFKDTRYLAQEAVNAAVAFANGETPVPNDTTTYDNGVFVVPTALLPTVIVTADNIQEELIDVGFYTLEQVQSGLVG